MEISLNKSRVPVPIDDAAPSPDGKGDRVFLLPGQLHVSRTPIEITTILGSCVSVCLWDMVLQVGGMNHYLLPTSSSDGSSMRYGDAAIPALLEQMTGLGCRTRDLVAKLFGGAALFQSSDRYLPSLGAKNIAVAQFFMKKAGIPVIAQDTGGHAGRKIVFHTGSGDVWSRRV